MLKPKILVSLVDRGNVNLLIKRFETKGVASNKVNAKQRAGSSTTVSPVGLGEFESDSLLQQYDFKPREYIELEPDFVIEATQIIRERFKKAMCIMRSAIRLVKLRLSIVISKLEAKSLLLTSNSQAISLSCLLLLLLFSILNMNGKNAFLAFLFFLFSLSVVILAKAGLVAVNFKE